MWVMQSNREKEVLGYGSRQYVPDSDLPILYRKGNAPRHLPLSQCPACQDIVKEIGL